jgi:hypothetical protein
VKKVLLACVAAAVAVAIAVPVAFGGGGGATVTKQCANPIQGLTGCQFNFFDGNGTLTTYNPSSFNDVITPSGNENEHFEGTIANNTGQDVTYNAGTPLTAGDTCYSFATKNTTSDWQLLISASGAYTLDCHFAK